MSADASRSNGARAGQHSAGQHQHPTQHAKDPSHCDTNDAEGQQENPYERIYQQRKQSYRPADHQEEAPQQEFGHISKYELFGEAVAD